MADHSASVAVITKPCGTSGWGLIHQGCVAQLLFSEGDVYCSWSTWVGNSDTARPLGWRSHSARYTCWALLFVHHTALVLHA